MSGSILGSFKNILMAVVVGLLLVSLAIWGVSDAFTPKTRDAAAMVGGEKISLQEFDRQFKRSLRDENQQLAERMTTQQAYERGLHQTVINQMITNKLIKIDANDLGLDVNQRDALKFVEGLELFNNTITGKFDETKLANQLYRIDRNLSRKQFEMQIFDAIRQEQSISSIVSGLVTPTTFVDQQYKFMTEQRTVKMLILDASSVVKAPDPSDDELRTFITEHQNSYIAPEYRRATVMRLELAPLILDMEASVEEIADQYDYKLKSGRLGTAETRSFSQILATDEAQAQAISDALNGGQDVTSVLTTFTLNAPIDYTDVLPGVTSDPLTGETAFTMNHGEARVLEGSFGTWYSVYVSAITPALIPSLEEQTQNISNEIKGEKAKKIIYDAQNDIQESLDEGLSIEEAAKAHGIPVASYDFISRRGENEEGRLMVGLAAALGISQDDDILKEIFTTDMGFEGDVFETSANGIAAIRVDAVQDSTPRPFEDIKPQALNAWQAEKTDQALALLLADTAQRAEAGTNLDSLAAEIGTGAIIREISMLRAIRNDAVSPQLAAQLFEAGSGETVRGRAADGISRIVGKIVEVTPNEEALSGPLADNLKRQAAQQMDSDIQTAYRTAILAQNPAQTIGSNISQILGVNTP